MERVISEEEMLKSIMGGSEKTDENFHSESCLLLLMDKFLFYSSMIACLYNFLVFWSISSRGRTVEVDFCGH